MKIKILLSAVALTLAASIADAQKLECTKQDNGSFTCTELTQAVGSTSVVKSVSTATTKSDFPVGVFIGGMASGVIGMMLLLGLMSVMEEWNKPSRGC